MIPLLTATVEKENVSDFRTNEKTVKRDFGHAQLLIMDFG